MFALVPGGTRVRIHVVLWYVHVYLIEILLFVHCTIGTCARTHVRTYVRTYHLVRTIMLCHNLMIGTRVHTMVSQKRLEYKHTCVDVRSYVHVYDGTLGTRYRWYHGTLVLWHAADSRTQGHPLKGLMQALVRIQAFRDSRGSGGRRL